MRNVIIVILSCILSQSVWARDDIATYSIADLLATEKAKTALSDIPLYFGVSPTPQVAKTYGEVMTNKKTNAFMKSDLEACQWVMLSALKSLQQRAVKEGMNAVINIQSYYKKREFISETEFECGAGAVMAGVTLKGTLVKIENNK